MRGIKEEVIRKLLDIVKNSGLDSKIISASRVIAEFEKADALTNLSVVLKGLKLK